jgi:hypothetical protein
MSNANYSSRGNQPTERLDERAKRKSILGRLFEALAVGPQGRGECDVAAYLACHDGILTKKGARGHASPALGRSIAKTTTVTRVFGVTFGEASRNGNQTFVPGVLYRRWFVAIATTMTAISLQGGALALSKGHPSSSVTAIPAIGQSEASSITAHGGGTTLQDCMALWDAATHMSKQEWKAACKRTMVVEFPETSP